MITNALPKIALMMIVPKTNPFNTSTNSTVQSVWGLSNVVALLVRLWWSNVDVLLSRMVAVAVVVVVVMVEDSEAIGLASIFVWAGRKGRVNQWVDGWGLW